MLPLVWVMIIASVFGSLWVVLFDGAQVIQNALMHIATLAEKGRHQNQGTLMLLYAGICLVTQLIVIPSGSMILIVSGFIFGPVLAAGLFSIAQVLALWPVYAIAAWSLRTDKAGFLKRFQQRLLSMPVVKALKREGIALGMVLRLTPIIPSAAASCLAAGLNIPLRAFFIATLLVCWVRPLFFASIGGALQEVSSLQSTLGGQSSFSVWPIVLVFVAAVIVLVTRLWLARQQRY